MLAGDSEINDQCQLNEELMEEYTLLLQACQAWSLAGSIKDTLATLTASSSIIGVTGHREDVE